MWPQMEVRVGGIAGELHDAFEATLQAKGEPALGGIGPAEPGAHDAGSGVGLAGRLGRLYSFATGGERAGQADYSAFAKLLHVTRRYGIEAVPETRFLFVRQFACVAPCG